jgi:hypothetical protein
MHVPRKGGIPRPPWGSESESPTWTPRIPGENLQFKEAIVYSPRGEDTTGSSGAKKLGKWAKGRGEFSLWIKHKSPKIREKYQAQARQFTSTLCGDECQTRDGVPDGWEGYGGNLLHHLTNTILKMSVTNRKHTKNNY